MFKVLLCEGDLHTIEMIHIWKAHWTEAIFMNLKKEDFF